MSVRETTEKGRKTRQIMEGASLFILLVPSLKVNRDRYNIDAPGCKKKAYMDLDFRTLNGSEI